MSNTAGGASVLEDLRQHPYLITDPDRYVTCAIGLIDEIDRVTAYQQELIGLHRERPIDAIVGDDVSARVLTLVSERVLHLAQAGGQIKAIPRTYFMASGQDYGKGDISEEQLGVWTGNLTAHAGALACQASLQNVLVLTEKVGTGRAVGRIVDAFTAHGVDASHMEMDIMFSSLGGIGGSSQRRVVGVERHRPEPIARRHPDFDNSGARQLRSFIADYANVVYTRMFGIDPPPGALPARCYTTELRTNLEPKERRGIPYSRARFGLDVASTAQ